MFWGPLIGGLVGLGGGLINDALDTSEDDAEREAMRRQQQALEAIRGARGYIPHADPQALQRTNEGIASTAADNRRKAMERNQRYALSQISRHGRNPSGGY